MSQIKNTMLITLVLNIMKLKLNAMPNYCVEHLMRILIFFCLIANNIELFIRTSKLEAYLKLRYFKAHCPESLIRGGYESLIVVLRLATCELGI